MEEIDKKLREILWEVSGDESKRNLIFKKDKPDLMKDLEFDSVAIVEYMVCVEEEFGVSFDNSDSVDIIWDFGRLLEWIHTLKKQQS